MNKQVAETKPKGFSPARTFKNNQDAVENGVWRTIEGGSARLLVARFNNPAHTEFLISERTANSELLSKEDSAEARKFITDLGNRAMAKHILKGWEGILDEDGETPLEYSEENAYKLLSEFDEFSSMVFGLSTEVEQYRMYRQDDAVKN